MTVTWSDRANIFQTLTLTTSPRTAFAFQLLSIPSGLAINRISGPMSWEAFPGNIFSAATGGVGGFAVLELRDSTGTVIANTELVAQGGTVLRFYDFFVPDALLLGGSIWLTGAFTDTREVIVGNVFALADDTVIPNELALPEASGSNSAGVSSITDSFDPAQFNSSTTVFLLQALFGANAQISTTEPTGDNPTSPPAGLNGSVFGTDWNNVFALGTTFDPRTAIIGGTVFEPQTVNPLLITFYAAGTLPSNSTYVIVNFSFSPQGAGSPSAATFLLRALNSSGSVIGSTTTLTYGGTGVRSFNIAYTLPSSTTGLRGDITFGAVPNSDRVDWTVRVYCNGINTGTGSQPHRYNVGLSTYTGSLSTIVPYQVSLLSTTPSSTNIYGTRGVWSLEGFTQQAPAGHGPSGFVSIVG
jgi:hypothetical protein